MGGGAPKTCISKLQSRRSSLSVHCADKSAVVTCVDPRVHPEALLGLGMGETFIFRTVAGHPQPVLQDIAALDIEGHNCIEDVMIIYHTGKLLHNVNVASRQRILTFPRLRLYKVRCTANSIWICRTRSFIQV